MFKEVYEMGAEEKSGTLEELQEDMKQCGFHTVEDTDPSIGELPLDVRITQARLQIDDIFQKILTDSKLPLYLFDYIVTSVLADIRKADADTLRLDNH